METDLLVTTFPVLSEFQRAFTVLDSMGAACERIDPTPALSLVAVPALVVSREVRAASGVGSNLISLFRAGWITEVRQTPMPEGPAPEEAERGRVFPACGHYGARPLRRR